MSTSWRPPSAPRSRSSWRPPSYPASSRGGLAGPLRPLRVALRQTADVLWPGQLSRTGGESHQRPD
eukprot:scaffold451_cov365-Prasinococcus_capsulatus_cf.AAC.3